MSFLEIIFDGRYYSEQDKVELVDRLGGKWVTTLVEIMETLIAASVGLATTRLTPVTEEEAPESTACDPTFDCTVQPSPTNS
jgi:hypothetical protein